MNQRFRSFCLSVIATVLFSGIAIIALNYYVDPWRFFHDSNVSSWQGKGRLQNPGILKQKTVSTIVLGTSMTQNFSPNEIESLFDGPAAVLSISAGTGREQSLLALMAIREQRGLKNVIWGVHPGSFSLPSAKIKNSSFPAYMYDDGKLNDLSYLFNLSNSKKSLRDLREEVRDELPENWKNLQRWSSRYSYGCPHALELQINRRGLPSSGDDWLGEYNHVYENVRENLYDVVVENPEVQFVFFFPPFSSLYWSIISESQPRRFKAYVRVMREVAKQLAEEPNVRIFDFTAARSITKDLENYRDLTHFSGDVSSRLLEFMRIGQYQVSYQELANVGHEHSLAIYKNVGNEVLECLASNKL
ncbi:MAG: hypothetical protein ACRBBW_10300 [Cellvibrionaceae bacterium]